LRLRQICRGLLNLPRPPARARCFGVGAAKTGTHTLGAMFADRVPSAHEADAERLIALLLAAEASGERQALRRFLRWRDRFRRLTVDASQVNLYLIGDLEALFPGSRYVQSVRPPAAWLRSMVDDSLRREVSPVWMRFRDFRFGPPGGHGPGEEPLAAAGLHRLDGYLGYWTLAATRPQELIPSDRLLTVATADIGPRAAEIAAFARLPGAGAPPAVTHAFRNDTRSGLCERMDQEFLAERIEAVCGAAARALFPGWTAAAELARLRQR